MESYLPPPIRGEVSLEGKGGPALHCHMTVSRDCMTVIMSCDWLAFALSLRIPGTRSSLYLKASRTTPLSPNGVMPRLEFLWRKSSFSWAS